MAVIEVYGYYGNEDYISRYRGHEPRCKDHGNQIRSVAYYVTSYR